MKEKEKEKGISLFQRKRRKQKNKIEKKQQKASLISSLGDVLVWDTRTGKIVRKATSHKGPATSVSLSQNGYSVVSGGWDSAVHTSDLRKAGKKRKKKKRKWEEKKKQRKNEPRKRKKKNQKKENEKKIGIAKENHQKKKLKKNNFFNFFLGSPVIYNGHTDWILSTASIPNVNQVVSGGWDSTVRIWKSEYNVATLTGHIK